MGCLLAVGVDMCFLLHVFPLGRFDSCALAASDSSGGSGHAGAAAKSVGFEQRRHLIRPDGLGAVFASRGRLQRTQPAISLLRIVRTDKILHKPFINCMFLG